MTRKRVDLKRDVVDRNIVEFLHAMSIWIPEEILPMNSKGEPLVHLKRRNDRLSETRQHFWKPVGNIPEKKVYQTVDGLTTEKILRKGHTVWTSDADTNRDIIRGLLVALNVWSLPVSVQVSKNEWEPHPTMTATGIAFQTWYYRSAQDLCWNFFQILQNQKLCSEGAKRWDFKKTTIAPDKNHFRILVTEGWEWEKNSYYESKDPKPQE